MSDVIPPPPALSPPATTSRKHTRTIAPRMVVLPPTPPVRSPRAATIVRWFGLDQAIRQRAAASQGTPPPPIQLDLAPGTITLVTGPSGAGKSSLLRDVQRAGAASDASDASNASPTTWLDLASIPLPDAPIVDCFRQRDDDVDDDASLRAALLDLARVGLAEAWTYLRTPAELSDGQRWRLRLALALDSARRATREHPGARVILLADEFAALLDRVTACVVARSLRRAIGADGSLAALVATSHPDLARALAPDVTVHCDFGRILIAKPPTISRGLPHKAADVIGGPRAPRGLGAPGANGASTADAIGGFIRKRNRHRSPGGPMRKIVVTSLVASLATLALCSPTLRADGPRDRAAPVSPRGGNDRLLLEPRSPFERPRPLFEFDPRPSRRPIMPLYPTIERELYRGNGRIESDVEFDLRRRSLEAQRESERFEESHDRTLRIEQQERRAQRDLAVQQRIETESERLAAERARFYKSAGIDVSGAAADAAALRRLERAYQRDVKQLRRDRDAERKRLAKNDTLSVEARRAQREALDIGYRAAQAERRARYAQDRARLLNN